jgi:hypothetical protein
MDCLATSDSGLLKSPAIIVLEFICAFETSTICIIKLDAPTFGAYMLTTVISS